MSGKNRPRKSRTPGTPIISSSRDNPIYSSRTPAVKGGPLGTGFGGVSPLSSSGVQTSQVTDWLGRQVGNLPSALNSNGNFADFLNALLSDGRLTDELQALIMQAATQYGMTQDQRQYDQLLTQDQRKYDWQLLQDQRQYANPLNELSRIMGAGISRDAALQMMSGSAGNVSSGSGGSTTINSAVPSTGAASPFGGVENGRAANALNGVQMVANLVGQGINMYTAVQQAQMSSAQNYMTQAQLSAFKGINDITNTFNNGVIDGTFSTKDVQGLRTADDYYNYILDHKDTNLFKPLIDSGAFQNVFGTTYGRSMMNNHLEQARLSKDSGKLFDEYLNSQILQNSLSSISVDKIGAEMAKIGSEIRLNDQKVIESCTNVAVGNAQIEVLDEQGKWIKIQGEQLIRQTDSQTNLMDTQAYGADIQNQSLMLNYELNSAGFPMLKLSRIHQLEVEFARWQCATTPSSLQEMRRKWLQDPQNAADAAYLQMIYNNGVGDFATYYPTLWQLSTGFNAAGVNSMLRTTTGAGVGLFNIVRALTPVP